MIERRPQIQGLFHFVALAIVYAVAWFPVLGQVVLNDRRPIWLVGPLFVAGVYASLRIGDRAPLWLRAALSAPFWIVLVFFHVLFGTMSHWAGPLYFWVAVALAVMPALPRIGGRLTAPVLLAVPVVLFGWTVRDVWWSAPWMAAPWFACCAALAGGLIWMTRGGRLRPVSRAMLALFVFSLLIYPRGGVIYKLTFPGKLAAVVAQPGVEAVFDYADPDALREVCTQTMYMARVPGESALVTGPQTPCENVVVIRPGAKSKYEHLDMETRGGDNILFDPSDPRRAYVGTVHELAHVSLDPPKVLDRLRLQDTFHNLNFLHYDAPRDRIFVSFDFHTEVAVVDRKTFTKVDAIPCAPRTRTHDLWIDPVGGQVTVSQSYLLGWRIDTYDLETLAHKQTHTWPGDVGFHFTTIDPAGRRMYLASTAKGSVRVLDLDTLVEVDSFDLEAGLRNVNFDPVRRWVLIGSYFDGNLFVWDADRRRLVGSLDLGRRLRWIEVDPENGLWYATTAVGGFAIDPDAAFAGAR